MTTFDSGEAQRFAEAVFGGVPGGGVLPVDNGVWYGLTWNLKSEKTTEIHNRAFKSVAACLAYAEDLDPLCRSIWMRVTTINHKPRLGRRGGSRDSGHLLGMWADVDYGGVGHRHDPDKHDGLRLPSDEIEALELIAASGLPTPTLIVNSGGGLYPWWLLDEVVGLSEDGSDGRLGVEAADKLAAAWQRQLAAGAASLGMFYGTMGDLARVLRLPGSVNRKTTKDRPCVLLSEGGPRYSLEDLQGALDVAGLIVEPKPDPRPAGSGVLTEEQLDELAFKRAVDPSPFDVLEDAVGFDGVLRAAGWDVCECGGRPENDECWSRPDWGTTPHSANTLSAQPHVLVVHSPECGLPEGGGQKLTVARVFAWLHHGGDLSAASRDIRDAMQGGGSEAARALEEYGLPVKALAAVGDAAGSGSGSGSDDGGGTGVAGSGGGGGRKEMVDVTNPQEASVWLMNGVGTGPLSGIFRRGFDLVHTPRIGEEGYIPPRDSRDHAGPAQVHKVDANELAARVDVGYQVMTRDVRGNLLPALFPHLPAQRALSVPDVLPNVKDLVFTSHTPLLRADGSLLTEPGYDKQSGALYLPDAGLVVPELAMEPDAFEVRQAVKVVSELVVDFPFISPHDKANYLGALLTPILRALAPPAYKLIALDAPQAGSGKSLLAQICRIVHGGVFKAGLPTRDEEFKKYITSVLDSTTGAIHQFDNVRGMIKSASFEALLTSDVWSERVLGVTKSVQLPNDRLWMATGNNMSTGGDLERRTIWSIINTDMERPQDRTDFLHPDLVGYVKEHRGEILWALLTITRGWVVDGMHGAPADTSDNYSHWISTVRGIMTFADFGDDVGTFDHKEAVKKASDPEAEEWSIFLEALERVFGVGVEFTVADVIARTESGKQIFTPTDGGDYVPDPNKLTVSELPGKAAEAFERDRVKAKRLLGGQMGYKNKSWVDGRSVAREEQSGNDRKNRRTAQWSIRVRT